MSNKSGLQDHAQKRSDVLRFFPEQLTIYGADKKENQHLFDGRPEGVSESFVADIGARGIDTPVQVCRMGVDDKGVPIIAVVAGRRRVRAAAWVNADRKKRGEELMLTVPCIIASGTELDIFKRVVAENNQRQQTTPLVQAQQMERMFAMGASITDVCITMNISKTTIANYKALLNASVPVQRALSSDRISTEAAIELSKIENQGKQKEALEKMLSQGNVKGRAGKQAAKKARVTGGDADMPKPKRLPSRKFLEAVLEKATAACPEDKATSSEIVSIAALKWILGDFGAESLPRRVCEAIEQVIEEGKS